MEEQKLHVLLDDLQSLTQATYDNLTQMTEEDFEQFATNRQRIVQAMEDYAIIMTQAHKQRIQVITSQDAEILQHMCNLQNELGVWLEKRGSIREQKNAYQQVYAIDSLFIDHRN
ncbi:hypothetical protein [Paenibacillus sp. CMAA1364]